MKMIHIGDDDKTSSYEDEYQPPKSIQDLKSSIAAMSIYAEVQDGIPGKALVRVREDAGTNQYMASGYMDSAWLKRYAKKMERKETFTLYHFDFR